MLFVFLLFMSISSLALAYISYMGILKVFGFNKNNKAATYFQLFLVLAIVIVFNMLAIVSSYTYWIGSIPIAIMAIIVLKFYWENKSQIAKTPQEVYQANNMNKQFQTKVKKNKRK